jgi:hypothetical protein
MATERDRKAFLERVGTDDQDDCPLGLLWLASHIFAICSLTVTTPPVASFFSRNPWAIGVLARKNRRCFFVRRFSDSLSCQTSLLSAQ